MHVASNGWSARLYWLWILYNSVAFVVVLTAVAVLSWISADVLHLSLTNRSAVVALLVATAGPCSSVACSVRCNGLSSGSACRSLGSGGSWPASDRRCWAGCL
jgi:hypothetical protein